MNTIALGIIAGLSEAERDRKVEIIMMPDLIKGGDSHLLAIMLQSLLVNARKFTSRRLNAKIEFGRMQKSSRTIFFVHDTGAGFNAKKPDRLFIPFRRLHTPLEFPGTRIGLAGVQRIVSRLEGRVWAEGRLDQGATFYFTLQREEKH